MEPSKRFLYLGFCIWVTAILAGCGGPQKTPGLTIYSPPADFVSNTQRDCGRKIQDWEQLANTPIRPTLGTSRIKEILSAVHNLGLAYWHGCDPASLKQDREKGFILLSLANDFQYIPTRFFFGRELILGDAIDRDAELGRKYLQQVIYCDRTFRSSYRKWSIEFLREARLPYSDDLSNFDENCNQILGAYFKGPTVEFDALAFKLDWEDRSASFREDWSWLGSGFRGAITVVEEALPIALAGAVVYYSAKKSGEYQAVQFPIQTRAPHASSFTTTALTTPGTRLSSTTMATTTMSVTDAYCTSDFDCGFGKVCVKPSNSFSLQGFCGTLVDQFGTPSHTIPVPSTQPRLIGSCSFDADCHIGFKCKKMGSDLYGLCVK